MALPSNYRWIVVGKLSLRNRKNAPAFAPAFTLADLIHALSDRIARGDTLRAFSQNARVMWCADLDEDQNYHRLILQAGDKNVAGVSFLHFGTLQTRDIDKEEDEGGHFSSHILIRKTPDRHGRHLILIEKVPGIHTNSVKDHFTWVCKDHTYEKEVQDDDGDAKRFRAFVEIDGHQSRTIGDALRTGTLQDIEFVSHRERHEDGLDEDPVVEEVVHEARWEVKKRVEKDQARGLFSRIGSFVEQFRGENDDAKVFVRIKADNGQIRRTEVQHDGEEILEQAFIQNEIVTDFDPPLGQRHDGFREDMIRKMIEVASNAGD